MRAKESLVALRVGFCCINCHGAPCLCCPQRSPFFTQLDGKVNATDPDIQLVVVGLQEIEMGGSSVAMAAAKDALSYKMQASVRASSREQAAWGRSLTRPRELCVCEMKACRPAVGSAGGLVALEQGSGAVAATPGAS